MAISKILHMKDSGNSFHARHLKRALDYVMNPEKTQRGRLVGAVNCQADMAFEQMMDTKKQFGKTDKRQGYHIILSFKEDEVEPDRAFEITQKFVAEYLGDAYEAVFVVHDNTDHVHSHIVFNSVSFVDGKKYRYEKGDWAKYIQPITNKLCQEYGLSIIDVEDGSKEKQHENYKDWSEYREGSFVWADMIKRDLDSCILQAGNYEQFLETYRSAREAGFDNINIDLMSAIPDQTYEGWIHNLRTVAGLDPEHISAYSLIIEEGTPFALRTLNLPDEDAEYNMYEATAQILREYGFEQYEISNYAKKGRECRHNVGYWIRQDYLGFGLGASSLYGKERFANTQDMKKYLENSRTSEKIREKEPPLTREDEMAEFMFLGLRMTRGISKAEFERQFGSEIDAIYGDVLRKYKSMGLLLEENGRIFLSREGIHVSNSVMADFLP